MQYFFCNIFISRLKAEIGSALKIARTFEKLNKHVRKDGGKQEKHSGKNSKGSTQAPSKTNNKKEKKGNGKKDDTSEGDGDGPRGLVCRYCFPFFRGECENDPADCDYGKHLKPPAKDVVFVIFVSIISAHSFISHHSLLSFTHHIITPPPIFPQPILKKFFKRLLGKADLDALTCEVAK